MSAEDLEFEQLLREYASVEPGPGIEQRVMERVRTEGQRRRSSALWVAAAVAMCGAMALWVNTRPQEKPVQSTPVDEISNLLPSVYELRITPLRRRHVRQGLPVEETFPAHPQLTAGERALLKLIREQPESAKVLLSKTDPEPIVPIEIPELTIRPLEQ
jgi:hypothetical protein